MITYEILIMSIPHRHEKLCALLAELDRQWQPGVRVRVWRDNLQVQLYEKQQGLLEWSDAEYVSFLDDDDMVPPYYIEEVMKALASRPDYVGFPVVWTVDGQPQRPVEHSLRHEGWVTTPFMLFRDITCLNPVRRELAMLGRFQDINHGCDEDWAGQLRQTGQVKTEVWVNRPMYYYQFDSGDACLTPRRPLLPGDIRPLPSYPWLTVRDDQVKDAIALAVPSRERPGNIARLRDTLEKTCRAGTALVVGLDEDDPAFGQYPAGLKYEVRSGLRYVVPWINELAVPLARQYRFAGHVGDDNVFSTVGWDVRVREALEQTPFAFGNDLYPRTPGSLCCHIFCRSEVITALGYLGPEPGPRHMWIDPLWMAWGKAVGITYLDDVIIEHLHYTSGKAPFDRSYAASASLLGADFAAYREYCVSGRLNADILRIDPAGRQYSPAELAQFQQGLGIPW